MTLPPVPSAPDYAVDWHALNDNYDWVRTLRGVPQDAEFHAEGDVWIHTRMVLEALTELASWRALSAEDRAIVFYGALLHDVSKPACTRHEGERITSKGHSARGEVEARVILWRLGASFAAREHVARLVQVHQVPFFALDREQPRDLVLRLSQVVRCDLLALLTEADARGRRCHDQAKLIDNIELFRELCREQGCFDRPFAFASPHARFEYFRHPGRDPYYSAHDETEFEVTLMSGLPAAGKDTWLRRNAADLPVVSLDLLRSELAVAPEEHQGGVVAAAKERARELLRTKTPFAWNATNLSRRIRTPLVELFADYGARVRIVHCDASPEQLQARNGARPTPVPARALTKMLEHWQTADVTECTELVIASGPSDPA